MKRCIKLLVIMIVSGLCTPVQAAGFCSIQHINKAAQAPGPWINQSNWLAPENLRFGAQSAQIFIPLLLIKGKPAPITRQPAIRRIDLNKIKAIDPTDQQARNVAFLLDTRLYTDGFLVLRNGKVMSEQYWHGLTAQQPRLILDASRAILSLMGATAVAQGKLAADKSVIRYVPALAAQTGLRKLSIQRLLDANTPFEWSPKEISEWQAAGGWKPGMNGNDIRAWVNKPDRWERNFAGEGSTIDAGPEGDLLAWALSESYHAPLAQTFCENILGQLRPESPVFWLTDQKGIELSGGLAMSLRDYARLGEILIEARNSRNRSKIPNWLIETLTSSAGGRKSNTPELSGLPRGSEVRYSFVHLGGKPNRVAILGSHGSSLYIDLDQRLVIAIFASYPGNRNANMLSTLDRIWDAVSSATQPTGKR